jgi:hypothetical protein
VPNDPKPQAVRLALDDCLITWNQSYFMHVCGWNRERQSASMFAEDEGSKFFCHNNSIYHKLHLKATIYCVELLEPKEKSRYSEE